MNEGWIIVGLIIVGLVLLCLVLWVGKIILIGAGGLFYWASEQGFLGIAAYFACWIFLFPFMLIACAIYGFYGWLSLREDERFATHMMQIAREVRSRSQARSQEELEWERRPGEGS